MTDTEAQQQIATLRRVVLDYRWRQLAVDLVLANRVRVTRTHTLRVLEQVVHRRDCRHVPNVTGRARDVDDLGRIDGTYWQTHAATGDSLRIAMTEQRARACGTCRPNVDPSDMLDGAGLLPVLYLRTTAEQHQPRPDVAVQCPNPADCARLVHGQLVEGDVCECCGTVIGDPA